MKKIIKIFFILITLLALFTQINCVYATDQINGGAPEGAYTDTGTKAKTEAGNKKSGKAPEGAYTDTGTGNLGGLFSEANSFIKRGENTENTINMDVFKTNMDSIFNILLTVGIVLTVIVGGVLGIKFMMASAEDKAQIKEALIPYIVGCVVIYGAFAIWKLVITVLQNL